MQSITHQIDRGCHLLPNKSLVEDAITFLNEVSHNNTRDWLTAENHDTRQSSKPPRPPCWQKAAHRPKRQNLIEPQFLTTRTTPRTNCCAGWVANARQLRLSQIAGGNADLVPDPETAHRFFEKRCYSAIRD